ncbi:hypothetical protein A0123_03224 [Gluconobacter cerinus]|uniref:Uncharacterized protein n=1 Tax=Gluconobacter cerinus TaxID=38307 RepID=A0A1B6VGJ7_9PROT|nr:hypothetical protein A0123_03224 [Gluconobacter cerinus]
MVKVDPDHPVLGHDADGRVPFRLTHEGRAPGLTHQLETADLAEFPPAFLLGTLGGARLTHQPPAGILPLGQHIRLAHKLERLAPCRLAFRDIRPDLRNNGFGHPLIAFGPLDRATHVELVVVMGGFETTQTGQLRFQSRLFHQAFVARGQCLRHGKLVRTLADILQTADRPVSRHGQTQEALLALQKLPVRGIH